MRCAPSAPPAALPPLDYEGNDDETLNDDDVGGLIAPLDDLPQADDDDDLLTDPDFGIDPPSDPFANDRDTPLEIDIGTGFGLDAKESEPEPDDSAGLEQPFGSGLADDAEEALPPDAEERDGIDDRAAPGEGLELPDIDADEQGSEIEDGRFGLLVAADETSIASAEHPWRATTLSPERERCGALAVADGTAVAGSSDLLWLERGRATPVRIALEGTRITSLALVGRERHVALCVTAFGRLLRRTRLGADSERLHDWRRAADCGANTSETLELRQLGPEEPRAVLGRVASGRLIRSDDEGTSFQALEPAVHARALSASGSPLVLLYEDGVTLGLSFDGGQRFEARELPTPAREVAGGETPLLAASGSTIAIADPARGLAVSNDGGKTFRLVAGAVGVTACTAGSLAGEGLVWAALYREASDATDLVLVNATTLEARIIARLETPEEQDPEHAFEGSRLERLVWDGEQLFGVGGAGLVSFQPTPK
jgi:hypothetical protein